MEIFQITLQVYHVSLAGKEKNEVGYPRFKPAGSTFFPDKNKAALPQGVRKSRKRRKTCRGQGKGISVHLNCEGFLYGDTVFIIQLIGEGVLSAETGSGGVDCFTLASVLHLAALGSSRVPENA